ncbi:MAG: hypothetical protein KC474_10860 [Cyanobacteria bacterium HKST-UBA04]|nr:hypothetical protein [Cyanobacteria bacterium HKST-UBA04]
MDYSSYFAMPPVSSSPSNYTITALSPSTYENSSAYDSSYTMPSPSSSDLYNATMDLSAMSGDGNDTMEADDDTMTSPSPTTTSPSPTMASSQVAPPPPSDSGFVDNTNNFRFRGDVSHVFRTRFNIARERARAALPDVDRAKRYFDTFLTDWRGQEGELWDYYYADIARINRERTELQELTARNASEDEIKQVKRNISFFTRRSHQILYVLDALNADLGMSWLEREIQKEKDMIDPSARYEMQLPVITQ